jgi:hypothetical protein
MTDIANRLPRKGAWHMNIRTKVHVVAVCMAIVFIGAILLGFVG